MKRLPNALFLLVFLLSACPARSQESSAKAVADEATTRQEMADARPLDLLGLTLRDLLSGYELPERVTPVRGRAPWQDDVAFIYPGITLYIAQDRVWQVSAMEAFNIKVGDKRDVALLTMGQPEENRPAYLLFGIDDRPWPVKVRFGINEDARITSIFVYRSDF